jgi:hypothetical protein
MSAGYKEGPEAKRSSSNHANTLSSSKAQETQEKRNYFTQTEAFRQGLERLFRFPRPCRFVARRFVSPCQLAYVNRRPDALHCFCEHVR